MDWFRRHNWPAIAAIGLVQAVIGYVFIELVKGAVSDSLLRDLGIVTILCLVIVLGGLILIRLISARQTSSATDSLGTGSSPVRSRGPAQPAKATRYVIGDNVRWEDWGNYINDGMIVGGPICPGDDLTPLRKRRDRKTEQPREDEHVSDYHGPLVCISCGNEYLFDTTKSMSEARDEAKARLISLRNQAEAAEEAAARNADVAAQATGGIEFYPDRTSMVAARGGLRKELEGVYVAWASWYAGTHATTDETFRTTHKPQKLLLLNPDGKSAPLAARLFRRPLHLFKTEVETTCDKALEAGTDVRLFDGPMTLMLIAEPEARSGKGWVRVEIAIPDSAVRPNIVIYEASHPQLFQEFVAAFKAVFDHPDTASFVGAGQVATPPAGN